MSSTMLLSALSCAVAAVAFGWWHEYHQIRHWRLPDGTELFFHSGTSAEPAPGYPRPRSIHVDGDVLVQAPDTGSPLLIHSRLLTLKISGNARLRVTAFASEPGEEAEVLSGRVLAQKAYPSRDSAPDELEDGDMVMVNQSIDLMEKERDAPGPTRRWADELVHSAGKPILQR